MATIPCKIQLDAGATIPTRNLLTDVGYNITARSVLIVDYEGNEYPIHDQEDLDHLCANDIAPYKVKIDTGIHLQTPGGFFFEVVPDARIADTSLMLANSVCIIDPTYSGSVRLVFNVLDIRAAYNDISNYLPSKTVGQLILRHRLSTEFVQVAPVKPFQISEGAGIIEIWRDEQEVTRYWCYNTIADGVKALAEAEAECARLNEERRKEHAND